MSLILILETAVRVGMLCFELEKDEEKRIV